MGGGNDRSSRFDALQAALSDVLAANRPGSDIPHVCIALPSFSVGESLLSHYANRIPTLEHRYLHASLMLARIDACELVFLCCVAPSAAMVDYQLSLVPPARRADARARFRVFEIPDHSARSVAAKLLDRPDLIAELRGSFGARPVVIEPWNVTEDEVEVAFRLGAPINGTRPELWPLGFKSAGRRIFKEVGVPVPVGFEDVRTVSDVVGAIRAIRRQRPSSPAVVVKHDNSGAGDGNVVIPLDGLGVDDEDEVRARVSALPAWFLHDLEAGGVVEERIVGARFSSPSVQLDLRPGDEVVVLSTHEQELAGDESQVYSGCRFPADPAYAPTIATYAARIGAAYAARGALGRLAVDFVVASNEGGPPRPYALEVNLRKGGTTHPFVCLRHLVPGVYDVSSGRWRSELDGAPRWYRSTDNLVDDTWLGVDPQRVVNSVAAAGLAFDHATGAGVVLHMLSGLAIDGRFGVTAIGRSRDEVDRFYDATVDAVHRVATSDPA